MKNLKKIVSLLLVCILALGTCLALGSCSGKETIIIYSSAEDFRIASIQQSLNEKFPEYNIVIEYKDSGSHAAAIKASGTGVGCHITHDLEYSYAQNLTEYFANIEEFIDESKYEEDTIIAESKFFAPEVRNGGAIILNMDVINEKCGGKVPTSYEDLLDPVYKNYISMPDPSSSGTGYMFLLSLVNEWGEDEALEYFEKLSENVKEFTTSGSGPVNALVLEEVAIGLGMTSQAVQQINKGANLEIKFFEEGSPYSLYGQTIIKGNEDNEAVVAVFEYLCNEVTREQSENFYPEKIFTDTKNNVKNYPTAIKYCDMSNNTIQRKEALIELWENSIKVD